MFPEPDGDVKRFVAGLEQHLKRIPPDKLKSLHDTWRRAGLSREEMSDLAVHFCIPMPTDDQQAH